MKLKFTLFLKYHNTYFKYFMFFFFAYHVHCKFFHKSIKIRPKIIYSPYTQDKAWKSDYNLIVSLKIHLKKSFLSRELH